MTEQTQIDPFRELNRYDEYDADYRSGAVYESPRRTLADGWRKFHADRDCGRGKVTYFENISTRPHSSDRYEYDLYCRECGHRIDESEVLFLGGEWYSEHGWRHYGRPLEDLFIPPDRVLELGPNPDRDELVAALELG